MTRKLFPDIKKTNIYIDTNVLWNYCKGKANETACLKLLFSKENRHPLFTSTFAIGQTMAGIQKSNNRRSGLSKADTIKKGKYLCAKMTVLDFSYQDIEDGFLQQGSDVEDNFHYTISERVNCNIVITNDVAGYEQFDVIALRPEKNLNYMRAVLQISN